jgi:hypothetical protein
MKLRFNTWLWLCLATWLLLALAGCDSVSASAVEGVVKNGFTDAPQQGVRILLARKQASAKECQLKDMLSGTSDNEGRFSIAQVPNGEYLVLYTDKPTDAPEWAEKKINWQEVELGAALSKGLGTEILKGSVIQFSPVGEMTVKGGYMASLELGLGFLVEEGEPRIFKKEGKAQPLALNVQKRF